MDGKTYEDGIRDAIAVVRANAAHLVTQLESLIPSPAVEPEAWSTPDDWEFETNEFITDEAVPRDPLEPPLTAVQPFSVRYTERPAPRPSAPSRSSYHVSRVDANWRTKPKEEAPVVTRKVDPEEARRMVQGG